MVWEIWSLILLSQMVPSIILLYYFLNLGSIEAFEYIKYMADGMPYTITPKPDVNSQLGFHSRKNKTDGTTQIIRSNRNNNLQSIDSDVEVAPRLISWCRKLFVM